MSQKQIFAGFTPEEEEKYASEAEQMYDPDTVRASNKKWKSYSEEQKKAILNESKQIYLDMIAAMPGGAASSDAQACVERWRKNMDYFWTPSLDQLVPLASNYVDDPRFKATFDQIHPGLAAFVRDAVEIYVKNHR